MEHFVGYGSGSLSDRPALERHVQGRVAASQRFKVFIEREPGPELDRAITLTTAHAGILVVESFKVLEFRDSARDRILRSGMQVWSVAEPKKAFGLWLAERVRRSEGTKKGLARKISQGWQPGNRTKGRDTQPAVKARNASAEVHRLATRKIVEQAKLTTAPLRVIADFLNERGVATYRNNRWHASSASALFPERKRKRSSKRMQVAQPSRSSSNASISPTIEHAPPQAAIVANSKRPARTVRKPRAKRKVNPDQLTFEY